MKRQKVCFELQVFNSLNELSQERKELIKKAVEARKNAYAPYSNFQVGAAVLLNNGKVVIGNNQENASFPSGLCAERVAVFQAGAKYPGETIRSIAISAASKRHTVDKPVAPCGNCRQSISEYEVRQKSPIELFLMGEVGQIIRCASIADILPLAFDTSFL
ncbi:cytidine deaminase [Ulvibacterium marinum]|uniref:cytidine deaminase n=1 Tax=Ulvibacterium marinum TaxID=2419782 RepID=UPI0024956763|nr:cytidine deaminase [Ulvibacterium marinum]